MTQSHPGIDRLAELALGEVPPAQRAGLQAHLVGCPACAEEHADLAAGVAAVVVSAPSARPPEGFAGRVLEAMAAERPHPVAPVQSLNRPRPRTRLLVAAAALAGIAAGAGGVLGVQALTARPPASAPAHGTAVPLVTGKGDAVGSAGIASTGGRSFLLLNITAGRPGASYDCVLVGRDGTRTSGGTWTLAGDYAQGSGSWLVALAGDAPASVELITASGTVWSRAAF